MNTFYQLFAVGINCIEGIDCIVSGSVGGGIVENKQRVEPFQTGLSRLALHLLRLVHDDNRPVGGNHVDWTTGTERVLPAVDDPAVLVPAAFLERGGEGLGIDDHHIDAAVACKLIQIVEIAAVVYEIAGFFAVLLHEVLFQHGKALVDSFTDGNAGHYDDELAPSVQLVEFEHGFDIDVSLPSTSLHLDIQTACSHAIRPDNVAGHWDIRSGLYFPDIVQQLQRGKFYVVVAVAEKFVFIPDVAFLQLIAKVASVSVRPV